MCVSLSRTSGDVVTGHGMLQNMSLTQEQHIKPADSLTSRGYIHKLDLAIPPELLYSQTQGQKSSNVTQNSSNLPQLNKLKKIDNHYFKKILS